MVADVDARVGREKEEREAMKEVETFSVEEFTAATSVLAAAQTSGVSAIRALKVATALESSRLSHEAVDAARCPPPKRIAGKTAKRAASTEPKARKPRASSEKTAALKVSVGNFLLAAEEPVSALFIATALNEDRVKVSAALKKLCADGTVVQYGERRFARYAKVPAA